MCRGEPRARVCVCKHCVSLSHTHLTNKHTPHAECRRDARECVYVCVFLLLMFGLTLPRADSNAFGISCARAFVRLCWCCVINSSDSRRKPDKTPKKVEDVLVEALYNETLMSQYPGAKPRFHNEANFVTRYFFAQDMELHYVWHYYF